MFSIGFNLGICCSIQVVLGFMLCWIYSNSLQDSFKVMFDVSDNEFGSLLRLGHSTMASMVWFLLIAHMGKTWLHALVFESSWLV